MLITACGGQQEAAPEPEEPVENGTTEEASGEEAEEALGAKIQEIQDEGKIVLGTAADYPPYEFIAEIDGELQVVGFDIDIAREIANDLGVELEIRDMDFDGLLAALVAGNIDFIVAGMVPTEERRESVDFSMPYYAAEQRFLVRAEDVDELNTIDSLEGKRIGAQMSTVQETIAEEMIENPAERRYLSRINDLVMDLKSGRIDGIVLVGPVASAYASADPDLEMSDISFGQEDGVAIAVAKGNEDLVAAIDDTLQRLIDNDMIDEFIAEATALADEQQVQ
ncbi:MAG: amino acid ABC transporter [Tindallia sp. MSAO_Bac2]|nr:MAG: amino acid ABC transporter [Tindallia sp. MSAO_Bac2]